MADEIRRFVCRALTKDLDLVEGKSICQGKILRKGGLVDQKAKRIWKEYARRRALEKDTGRKNEKDLRIKIIDIDFKKSLTSKSVNRVEGNLLIC